MVVRPRDDQDLPACVRALEAVHAVDRYPMAWPVDPMSWLSPPARSGAWVVEAAPRDGTDRELPAVAGHVCVVLGTDYPATVARAGVAADRVATVSRLFVAPDGRGQGLGASLLTAALTHAATHGLQLILDVVDDRGPAIAFYERLGWRLVNRRPANWTTPDGHRPQLRIYRAPAQP